MTVRKTNSAERFGIVQLKSREIGEDCDVPAAGGFVGVAGGGFTGVAAGAACRLALVVVLVLVLDPGRACVAACAGAVLAALAALVALAALAVAVASGNRCVVSAPPLEALADGTATEDCCATIPAPPDDAVAAPPPNFR